MAQRRAKRADGPVTPARETGGGAAGLSDKLRALLRRLVKAAFDGQQPEVDGIIRGAGYVGHDEPISQTELAAACPQLRRGTLAQLQQQGMPSERAGNRRLYRPLAVLNWIADRFVHVVRRRSGEPEELVNTQVELAERLKVDARTIRNWKHRGMPSLPDGRFDVAEIRRWSERVIGGSRGASGSLVAQEKQANIEYRKMRTRLVEYDLAVREGRLIRRADVETRRAAQLIACREGLLRLPDKLAARLEGLDAVACERLLREEIDNAIDHLRERNVTVGEVLDRVLVEFHGRAKGAAPDAAELRCLWDEACEAVCQI